MGHTASRDSHAWRAPVQQLLPSHTLTLERPIYGFVSLLTSSDEHGAPYRSAHTVTPLPGPQKHLWICSTQAPPPPGSLCLTAAGCFLGTCSQFTASRPFPAFKWIKSSPWLSSCHRAEWHGQLITDDFASTVSLRVLQALTCLWFAHLPPHSENNVRCCLIRPSAMNVSSPSLAVIPFLGSHLLLNWSQWGLTL